MTGIKEMLLKEQDRLEKILSKTRKQVKDAPLGSLRLSKSRGWIQYYHCMPGEKRNGAYIPKADEELPQKLAQKAYDEKVLKLAEKRLGQLKRITKDYEDDEIENLFMKEHPERRKLICPVEPSWDQQIQEWESGEYKRKEFREGTPVIMTDKGERVRSKSEKILADYFYRKGIPYKYECPLYLNGFGTVYPDFTFLSKKTGKEIYWEHDGKMDSPEYAENAVRKINAYEENDIFPGERLILTFETGKTILNIKRIEELVARYLI